MSRKQDNRYTSRPRSLTTHYGSTPTMLSSMLGSTPYSSPYSNNYGNSYSPSNYRNYNPYSSGFSRSNANLGIYGGTSSGYGGVYLGSTLGSLNLMAPQTNILKKLDKRLLASQKNFKPKEVLPLKVKEVNEPSPELPPVRPERKSRAANKGNMNKERSRSLTSLDTNHGLNSRSISLNSLAASDGYCSGSERTVGEDSKTETQPNYKALYESSQEEVQNLRILLRNSEKKLGEARSTILRLTNATKNESSIDQREKRAMERKLSEMEEELKCYRHLEGENQRLKDENGALIRVISKLSK